MKMITHDIVKATL